MRNFITCTPIRWFIQVNWLLSLLDLSSCFIVLVDRVRVVAFRTNVVPSFATSTICRFSTPRKTVVPEANGFSGRVCGSSTQLEDMVRDTHASFPTGLALGLKPWFLDRGLCPFSPCTSALGILCCCRTACCIGLCCKHPVALQSLQQLSVQLQVARFIPFWLDSLF